MQAQSSLERLLSILDIFTEDRTEWRPEEMMDRLGYSRPTLYRYLKTLTSAGVLTPSSHGAFTLGPKVVEMDFLLRRSDRLILEGQSETERLAAAFPCTAFLVRWYRDRMLCVHSNTSLDPPPSSYPRGRAMPLDRGAIARAILAFLPTRKARAIVASHAPKTLEDDREAHVAQRMRTLREVRRAGHSIAFGEVTPGVVAVAGPIFDAAAEPVGALCVTMRQEDTPLEVQEKLRADVTQAARTITMMLRAAR